MLCCHVLLFRRQGLRGLFVGSCCLFASLAVVKVVNVCVRVCHVVFLSQHTEWLDFEEQGEEEEEGSEFISVFDQ